MEERQDHATRTISIVMIIALVGKVLGLYRDRLLAVHYSVGPQASAFLLPPAAFPGSFLTRYLPRPSPRASFPCSANTWRKKGRKRPTALPGSLSPSWPCSPGGDGAGDAVPAASGGPVCRLCRPGHGISGGISDPGDVSHGTFFRNCLLPGGGSPGFGPFYCPGPYVCGVQSGDYPLLFRHERAVRDLRAGRGLSAGVVSPGGHPGSAPAQAWLPLPARAVPPV